MTRIDPSLHRRITVLESQVLECRRDARCYRRISLTLGMGLMGVFTLAATIGPSVPEVLQARRLEVIGADGQVVFAASAASAGGQLDLWSNGE